MNELTSCDISDIVLIETICNLPSEQPSRRARVYRERPNYMDVYDDKDFYDRFRLTKATALLVQEMIEDKLQFQSERNNYIPPQLQLLTCLRFFATGCYLRVAADLSGVSKASASRIVKRVSRAIAALKGQYINMPKAAAVENEKKEFFKIAGFPGIIGCIDCTHIKIACPIGVANPNIYMNRKGNNLF